VAPSGVRVNLLLPGRVGRAEEGGGLILFGCALAFVIALAPRVVLVLAWIFSDRWPKVWNGDFLLPLLGIVFVPYTTVMYMLVWTPLGIQGWDWLWIGLGLVLDATKWANLAANRRNVPGYADSMP
jgi:hypothetical protein